MHESLVTAVFPESLLSGGLNEKPKANLHPLDLEVFFTGPSLVK